MKEHDLKKTVFENVRTALKEDLMEQEDLVLDCAKFKI